MRSTGNGVTVLAEQEKGDSVSRKCVICHHEQKPLIDDCLIVNGIYRQIADAFALSKDSVRRHARNHLPADHQVIHTEYQIDQVIHGLEYAERWQRVRDMLRSGNRAELQNFVASANQKRTQTENRPVTLKTKRPVCRCRAYGFPHKLNSGFCRYPDDPLQVWQGVVGKPSEKNLRKRQGKWLWRFIFG